MQHTVELESQGLECKLQRLKVRLEHEDFRVELRVNQYLFRPLY